MSHWRKASQHSSAQQSSADRKDRAESWRAQESGWGVLGNWGQEWVFGWGWVVSASAAPLANYWGGRDGSSATQFSCLKFFVALLANSLLPCFDCNTNGMYKNACVGGTGPPWSQWPQWVPGHSCPARTIWEHCVLISRASARATVAPVFSPLSFLMALFVPFALITTTTTTKM